jgi:hypothetical protein
VIKPSAVATRPAAPSRSTKGWCMEGGTNTESKWGGGGVLRPPTLPRGVSQLEASTSGLGCHRVIWKTNLHAVGLGRLLLC